jgi:hypothetical protein
VSCGNQAEKPATIRMRNWLGVGMA